MRKTKSKSKEIIKVIGFTALSIGILSASFFGINERVLAGNTTGTEILPPITANALQTEVQVEDADLASAIDSSLAETQTEDSGILPEEQIDDNVFVSPTLTVLESEHSLTVPAHALSMDEAVQIGVRYIWDVFGTTLDGRYLRMWFANHDSQSNTWWGGSVTSENPIVPDYVEEHPSVEYMFIIDGVTGERIDILHMSETPRSFEWPHSDSDEFREVMANRTALVEAGWFDMDIDEQIALSDISQERLDLYTEAATILAQNHFNNSSIADVRFFSLAVNGLIASDDGCAVDLAGFDFSITDDTGREAIVRVSTESAFRNMISISTQHNDFIPGFSYDGPGGIG